MANVLAVQPKVIMKNASKELAQKAMTLAEIDSRELLPKEVKLSNSNPSMKGCYSDFSAPAVGIMA